MDRRLREAARIGLTRMVVPPGASAPEGCTMVEIATVAELLGVLRDLAPDSAPRARTAREGDRDEGW
jgi:hypothetical protein